MENTETPELLTLLLETVDDPKIFAMSGVTPDHREAFKAECRAIFTHLYDNAARQWNDRFAGGADSEPEFPGITLFEQYADTLVSCWLESFDDGILAVAKRRATGWADVKFLYFMLGYMAFGFEEAIRRIHEKRACETSENGAGA